MKFICPLLVVSNISQSRKFYESVLNQRVKIDFGENVTFEGDFSIHLDKHYQSLIGNKQIQQGGNNMELYFEHDDVDLIATTLRSNGTRFVHEVQEQPWRQKVLRVYDPDGHIVEIGESMEYLCFRLSKEGISEKKISKLTMMPLDFVNKAIQERSL